MMKIFWTLKVETILKYLGLFSNLLKIEDFLLPWLNGKLFDGELKMRSQKNVFLSF